MASDLGDERKVVSLNHWDGRWTQEKDPSFHRKVYSPHLERFYSKAFGKLSGKRIFVPLCGKTLDLLFLADNGHEVIGLEFSELAVRSFFEEGNLAYSVLEVKNEPFVKYQAKDKSISIFQGDLFSLKPEICGQFDGVWDRGSYVAINVSTRKAYVDLMSSLLKSGGRILMEACDFNPVVYNGPPHNINEDNIKNFFGENFEEEILYVDHDSVPEKFKLPDMGYFSRIFMLTRK